MNKQYIALALAAATILAGCRQNDLELPKQRSSIPLAQQPQGSEHTLPYVIRLRFSPEGGRQIEQLLASDNPKQVDLQSVPLLKALSATHLERVFPYAGKYEERTRREGLHLWYDITLDETLSLAEAREARQKAMEVALQSSEVTSAELVYVVDLPQSKVTYLEPSQLRGLRAETKLPTDDPLLPKQWHYHNDGSLIRSVVGADINLFEAWKQTVGRPEVIVSVVDGGIDYNHEDLRDNMYINQKELTGTKGKDDDGNGVIDDVYGYNFVFMNSRINPHEHGTHVAGTVAARSNNGIGVAGVAGGDGTSGSGVRLMTCQTFDINPITGRDIARGFEAAIKYGADNGAVISQNSWGVPEATHLQPSYKAAIDYFIKYAGCDNEGNQLPTSPMKGGVLIFAAGNSGRDYRTYPAAYPEVVSVSAMSTDFGVAPYSNRGDWVSIMAPGGDIYEHHGQVLSTLPNDRYGYQQGTSMACPHVSGVAALIVSKFGGQGFTNVQLKQRLTTSISSVDINKMNPKYVGRLGLGYIDAVAALAGMGNALPQIAKWDPIVSTHTGLDLSWSVSADADDQKALGYKLYISKRELNKGNLDQAKKVTIVRADARVGEKIHYQLDWLDPDTQYFFALQPYDRWGNVGELSFASAKTLTNRRPVINVPQSAPIRLLAKDTYELVIPISDPDGDRWSAALVGQSHGASITQTKEGVRLKLVALGDLGKYQITLKVTDELGASQEAKISFEVYQNQAPQLVKPLGKHYLPIGREPLKLDLKQYFVDPNEESLTYAVRVIGTSTVEASVVNGVLTISGKQVGFNGLDVSATDPKGAVARAALEVEVVKDEIVYLVYPSPVSTTLNIRMANHLRRAMLRIFTQIGAQVLSKSISLPEGQQIAQVDVSKLVVGTYILQVEAEGKTFRRSFIKR
ncbi:MAG: S8 family serine peptidase [Porphyromonadaceae bacterium]|nr:S8 family serine peptidase [Porphyromonadaceae bacterium]